MLSMFIVALTMYAMNASLTNLSVRNKHMMVVCARKIFTDDIDYFSVMRKKKLENFQQHIVFSIFYWNLVELYDSVKYFEHISFIYLPTYLLGNKRLFEYQGMDKVVKNYGCC